MSFKAEWEAAKQARADAFYAWMETEGLTFDSDNNLFHAASGKTYWMDDDYKNGITLSERMELNKR